MRGVPAPVTVTFRPATGTPGARRRSGRFSRCAVIGCALRRHHRAALIYQHRAAERDRLIATVMSELIEAELGTTDKPQARIGHGADRTHPGDR